MIIVGLFVRLFEQSGCEACRVVGSRVVGVVGLRSLSGCRGSRAVGAVGLCVGVCVCVCVTLSNTRQLGP